MILLCIIKYCNFIPFDYQDGNLVFAEECQNNLLPILQQWFQLDDTTDRTLSVALFSFINNKMKLNKESLNMFSLSNQKAFKTFLHFGDGSVDHGNL